jgi:HlyD family secretion protein
MKNVLMGIPAFFLILAGCANDGEAFDAAGSFEATEVVVSAETVGKILDFPAREGQGVDRGQRLCSVDDAQLVFKRDQLRASLSALESRRPDVALQIASLEQQLATARTERRRAENLLRADAANAKLLDDADAQVALLEKQLAAQLSSLSRNDRALSDEASVLRLQIAEAEDQIAKSSVESPVAGVVLVKYAEGGEFATIGKPLLKVADLGELHLRAYVAASQLSELKLGQRVRVFADYGEREAREYPGEIAWISEKAEFTPKSIQTRDERADLVYAVKVRVKNDGLLKIGMYGYFLIGGSNGQG